LLVVAPITAPAAAPIAASRFVCFSVTVRGSRATVAELLAVLDPRLDDERRAVVVRRAAVDRGALVAVVRAANGAGADAVVNALSRSSAEMLSIDARCCAASDRSRLNALSAALLSPRPHAPVATSAAIASAEKVRVIRTPPL